MADSVTNTNRPFVTTGEIVRLGKVHPNTVAVWRATGKIVPRDKVGSTFLYDRKEVEAFLQNRVKFDKRRKYNKNK